MSHTITVLSATLSGSGATGEVESIKRLASHKWGTKVTVTNTVQSRFNATVFVKQDGSIDSDEFITWFRGIASHMKVVK